jgi:hypothetical protein
LRFGRFCKLTFLLFLQKSSGWRSSSKIDRTGFYFRKYFLSVLSVDFTLYSFKLLRGRL